MTGIRRILTLVLVLLIVTATGIIAVNALETSEKSEVSASETEIVVFVRQDGLTQPYIYLWNSLPTNSAMSKSYPGEKMTKSGNADGKQYSREYKLTAPQGELGQWWFSNGRWTKYDPDEVDPPESVDMREESIYFVMTTRFYDGDSGNNVHCWDDSKAGNPDSDPAWRGDFKGLAEKLDYIKALGFSAIWGHEDYPGRCLAAYGQLRRSVFLSAL